MNNQHTKIKRGKRSAIWRISRKELEEITSEPIHITDVLKKLNRSIDGGQHRIMKERLEADGLEKNIMYGNAGRGGRGLTPLEDAMVENSTYKRGHLKKRLIDGEIIPNLCAICGCPPIWMRVKLVMVLDHINGICNDHRLENLRLLCPNCNSQTPTFTGRNKKYKS